MLDEHGKAKYADFGISCILDELEHGDNFKDSAGTSPYMAPEICDPEIVTYSGKKADIWALGIATFGFTFNSMPYWGENEMKIFESIKNDPLVMPDDRKDVSPGLINIIKGMLEKDPSKRLTLDELKKDEWINQGFHINLGSDEAQVGMFNHYKAEDNEDVPEEIMEYA
jgi:serine/threonine protein kinase